MGKKKLTPQEALEVVYQCAYRSHSISVEKRERFSDSSEALDIVRKIIDSGYLQRDRFLEDIWDK
jgi:hypothetical protein